MDPNIQPPLRPEPNPAPEVVVSPPIEPLDVKLSSTANNLIRNNPKIKYGLVFIVLPVVLIVTVLTGGSISDVLSSNIQGRELRKTIAQEVNDNRSLYGFHISYVSSIVCDGPLRNTGGATQTCTADAAQNIAGDIKGKVQFTVTVAIGSSQGRLAKVRISDIQSA